MSTRRRFLKTLPAALAAGAAAPALARQQPPEPAARVPKEALDCAEKIIGLDFNDAEEEMALRGVNRNLESFEALRKIDIPPDTEPAVVFRPYLSGKRPAPGATPGAAIPYSRPRPPSFDSVEDLAFLPVTTLAALVQSRRVTSSELTKMYLMRLKAHGERLKAVVTLTEDLALAQAADADREIRAGRYRGPLHGIPWGAKDLFATKGIRTTWGAKPYEDQVIDLDATVVERLREAGAVLVAKLSMGALAQGGVWYGGSTRNPWNLERSSSGSSAGPGAATAAGLVGFALGTETLGSIISPSSANGVAGLRPTYGRVSRHGAMALSWTMDKIGPMCRTVEDCALVFNAIYGPDGKDETVVDAPFRWNPDAPLATLKVGYVKSEFEAVPESFNAEQRREREEQNKALAAALDAFRKAGVTLEPIELPEFPSPAIRFVLSAEAAAAFDDLTRTRGVDRLTAQGPGDWPNSFRTSRFVPAVEYIRAQRARTLLMRKMDALMQQYDAFLAPTRSASLTLTNLTGHPALALKAGFVSGLPLAIMITGRLYDEATVLRVGLAYERVTDWHTKNPVLI
jgi:Asp-tRNA(Asn)/Glu-tRNA(Gln) amidotransferase A subunit family amidase